MRILLEFAVVSAALGAVGAIKETKCAVSHTGQFILVSTEPGGYRIPGNDGSLTTGRRTWGKADPRLFDVVLPDFFEVDFVRVYDAVEPRWASDGSLEWRSLC